MFKHWYNVTMPRNNIKYNNSIAQYINIVISKHWNNVTMPRNNIIYIISIAQYINIVPVLGFYK